MLNSYKFGSKSPRKYKKWSPDVSFEDRYVKKREREDEYVKNFLEEDRPVLLVKNKHMYNPMNKQVLDDEDENYYKISENTHEVDDIDNALRTNENFIRKHTIVHNTQPYIDSLDPSAIYKVEGIEFLPEGFLELDPLLYKDEYEFENKLMEKSFEQDQRKLKALRRKQYEQRNKQKMRDVTIYLVDENKNKIVAFLDKWYLQNRRRMVAEEIEDIAKVLEVDRKKMADLQDVYLKRKEIINNGKLREYLNTTGRLKDDKVSIPPSLRKYFVKNEDADMKAIRNKLGRGASPFDERYYQQYGIKKLKRPFADRIEDAFGGDNFAQTAPVEVKERSLSKARSEVTIKKVSKPMNREPSNKSLKYSYSGLMKQKSSGALKQTPKNSAPKRQDSDNQKLKLYFDDEINDLLDKIKGHKLSQSETNFQKTSDASNKKSTDEDHRESNSRVVKVSIDKNTQKQGVAVQGGVPKQQRESSKGSDKNRAPTKAEKISQILNDYSHFEDIKRQQVQSGPQNEDDDVNRQSVEYYPDMNTFGRDERNQTESGVRNSRAKSTKQVSENNLEPKRITIVERSTKGMSVVTQKLRPTVVGDEYYYQTVEEIVDKLGKRSVTIITRNERGAVVSRVSVDQALIGRYYENKIAEAQQELNKDIYNRKVTIVVSNERGTVVSMETFKPSIALIAQDNDAPDIEEVFDAFGHRKSTIASKREKGMVVRSHKLRPTLVGNQYYQQTIDEVLKDNEQKKITLTTRNERGDIVSIKDVDPSFIGEGYYAEVINDLINDLGQRQVTVFTMNDRNETLVEQVFRPTGATSIGRKYIEDLEGEILEEVVDSFGNKKITLLSKDVRGESVVYQEIRPIEPGRFNESIRHSRKNTQIGDQYYGETIERIMEGIKKRKSTRRSHRNSGHQNAKISHPTQKSSVGFMERSSLQRKGQSVKLSVVGAEHYKALVDGIIIDETDINSVRVSIKPSQVGSYYFLELVEDALKEADRHESEWAKPSMIGDEYYEDLIDEALFEKLHAKPSAVSRNPTLITKVGDKSVASLNIEPSVRPTIIGENYYGQIIQSMLQHENNRKLTQFSTDRLAVRPTQILNEYFAALYAETSVHRHRLISAKQFLEEHYKKAVDDNIQELNTKKVLTKINGDDVAEAKNRRAEELNNKLKDNHGAKGSLKQEANKEELRDKSKTYANNLKETKTHEKRDSSKRISKKSEKEAIEDDEEINESFRDKKSSKSRDRQSLEKNSEGSSLSKHKVSKAHTESKEKTKKHDGLMERLNEEREVDGRKSHPVKNSESLEKIKKAHTVHVNHYEDDKYHGKALLSHAHEEFEDIREAKKSNERVFAKTSNKQVRNSEKIEREQEALDAKDKSPTAHPLFTKEVHHKKSQRHEEHDDHDNEVDRYDASIRESKGRSDVKKGSTEKKKREQSFDPEDEERLARKIAEIFAQERDKLSDDIIKKLENRQFGQNQPGKDHMLDKFYKFCKEILPHDSKYKESILFVSLFYYFLEKQGLKEKGFK